MEVDAQHLFRSHGIGYDAQVYLPGIGRVDFLIDGFLIVEVDGFAFHSSREALRRDLGRNNASTLGGFAVLRYMPEHIWFEPERVLAEIRAVLGRRTQHTRDAVTFPPSYSAAPSHRSRGIRTSPRGRGRGRSATGQERGPPTQALGQRNPGSQPRHARHPNSGHANGTLTAGPQDPSGWRRGPAPRGPRRRRPSG